MTIEQAQAEMSSVAKRLELAYPTTNRGRSIKAVSLVADSVQWGWHVASLPTLRITMAVVCFVPAHCVRERVANLLVVRSISPQA